MLLLGDASYAMYLFHYHIIAFISRVIFSRVIGDNNVFMIELVKLLFTIIVTTFVSIFIYKLVDMPIQKRLRNLTKL
jgi:peptidoglycan/LPS O-acetylase OafA/YrhL